MVLPMQPRTCTVRKVVYASKEGLPAVK